MKCILHIIPTLDRGGAEKQLSLLTTRLPRDRYDVHVALLTRSGPLHQVMRRHQVPVIEINKKWKFDPAAYWRLRRAIAKLRPALVHTWLFAANSYGRQAAIACGVPRIVAAERCVDRWKDWYELAIDRRLARRTDRIVANSSGVREFYTQHGLPADKFAVIPNGVDVAPVASADDAGQGQNDHRPQGIPETGHLVVAIGRLWPQKRYKDLIWAAHLLYAARGNVHLLIVGDGPQRWRLERYTRQLRATDYVHFLGQRDDVDRLLPVCDCLWLGSGYEGQSNAILEGMANRLPVVATDIPGNRDLVVDRQTGFLVAVGDRAGFARRTQQLLDDRQLAARLGMTGQQRVLKEFSVDRMVQRHTELYEELLA
ncbi:MAG: glycosyl transferase family 1 [Planctomycetaceae bacterium]|nr:glycosyl transferase family 1 [Planctomycetaceae bacterium]